MKKTGKKGFTLLEMLVAMAIIALLAGLLLPVVSKVKEQARRTQAKDAVAQLAMAWKTYLQDNRQFPASTVSEMSSAAIAILNSSTLYLEFSAKEANDGYLDPWGELYQVALDTDYDGTVTAGDHGAVDQSVVVWSKGRNNNLNDTEDDPADDVKSW